jgi:sulfite reductase (NADPH) flavoprotein alpha-component
MTQTTPPPIPALIPDSAPFTVEQRTWLNGFFTGFLSLDGGVNPLSPEDTAALMKDVMGGAAGSPAARGPPDDGDDGEAPWHDPGMPLAERMQLAESRPLRRKMMAAMGQQDCGQCGYSCEEYSNAIVLKNEERLNLCVPGGKETTRTLKALYAEFGTLAAEAKVPAAAGVPATPRTEDAAAEPSAVPTRDNPQEIAFVSRTKLNKKGSQKETWYIDLTGSGIDYTVGDALGVFPRNEPALVDAVIAALGAPPDFPIAARALREVLSDSVSLGLAPDMLFQLISYITGGERRQKAKALASGNDPDGNAATLDVLAALEKFPGIRPDPEAFIEALDPLQPRLYSIASSPKTAPGRVALTIDAVRYAIGKRPRFGVASTFFAERVPPGGKIGLCAEGACIRSAG